MAHDLVIHGGTIVDGTGAQRFSGDLAVDGGRIVAVGGRLHGERTIEADGAIVTPGWVDIHTHYDGQVTWDDQLDPSFGNGVTTLVMGNCGVGFAPCPPGEQSTLIELMEGVEDIPGTALHEGVPWGAWTTFPEYLDFLDSRRYALDVGAQLAHGSLRFEVMRERGVQNEDATAEDIAEMRRLVAEATAAGAVGFSTSRTIFHRAIGGEAVPGTFATGLELTELVQGMADGGGGVFEAITSSSLGQMSQLGGERFSQDHELRMLADISRATGQKLTFTTVQHVDDPEAWRTVLSFALDMNASGAKLYPQVASRPVGILGGLACYHPFMRRPSYLEIAGLPVAAQAQRLRDPEVKARILAERDVAPENAGSMEMFAEVMQNVADFLFPLDDIVDYEPGPERSFGAIAAARGVAPIEAVYDFLAAGDGTNVLSLPGAGYMHGDLEAVREMIVHPTTIVGLADAGAHVKLICDGSSPSTQLTHWTRDRTRGETIPLEFMVEQQTRRTARLYGLDDRGTIEVGARADLNVIDLDNLTVRRPAVRNDLPAGGQRYLQPVSGYLATIVNGVPTRVDDRDTGARPGRLLRGNRSS
jgi:N-acyl-D-amino-acid deacylase